MNTKRWLLLILMFLSVGVTEAQDAPLFTVYGDAPAVPHGTAPIDWDYPYTDPGAVFYHDGLLRMFRNGFKGWPNSVQIGYLTSPDGLVWTEATEEPVMRTLDVPYAEVAALASSALVEGDTWVLYFYTWNTRSGISNGDIGRATSSDPLGPWTPDDAPVLTRGAAGEWDAQQVSTPDVVKLDDGSYRMHYTGHDSTGRRMIGMATSDDGITWTKYDDPSTSVAPFADSDPIFTPAEDWEAGDVHQPRVVQSPEGWVMIYRAQGQGRGMMRLGLATSDDGLHWTRADANPIWKPDNVPGGAAFWYTALAYHNDTYYLYVETAPSNNRETDIWAAYHEGSLVGE
jgi:predicted GH43/DUF377 family glycosyl hydrolase